VTAGVLCTYDSTALSAVGRWFAAIHWKRIQHQCKLTTMFSAAVDWLLLSYSELLEFAAGLHVGSCSSVGRAYSTCNDLTWVSSQAPMDEDWVQRENHRDEVMSGQVIYLKGDSLWGWFRELRWPGYIARETWWMRRLRFDVFKVEHKRTSLGYKGIK